MCDTLNTYERIFSLGGDAYYYADTGVPAQRAENRAFPNLETCDQWRPRTGRSSRGLITGGE